MDTDKFYREFGRRIAARRIVLSITQSEVGQRLGVSRASIANIEAGRQKLYLHQLYSLARALRLEDLSQLLPIQVPVGDDDEPLDDRHEFSAVQRAQIESVVRNAVAAARPRSNKP